MGNTIDSLGFGIGESFGIGSDGNIILQHLRGTHSGKGAGNTGVVQNEPEGQFRGGEFSTDCFFKHTAAESEAAAANGSHNDNAETFLVSVGHIIFIGPVEEVVLTKDGRKSAGINNGLHHIGIGVMKGERQMTNDSLIDIRIIQAFETVELGDYSVTALPARHMPGGEPLIYVIRSDKTILYAHDTGYFLEEVFDYIRGAKLYFDMVSIDCTNVDIPIGDEGNHMGFPNDARLLKRLADMGAIDGKTIKYVNHFSHNGNPLQENLEKKAAEIGCSVAYDGCSVCI